MSGNTTRSFCQTIAAQIPDLDSLLSEHVADYDEILPNVFMGDVTRYVLADGAYRTKVVGALEEALCNRGPEVEELIAVSFVENLETQEELDRAVRGVNAPQIIAEWKRQKSA